MKTVGQILKEARQKQNVTLKQVSQETKIGIHYLKAIEANDFNTLPAATFAKGLMQNYAKAIGLNPATILAIFRRDYDLDDHGKIILRGLTEPNRARLSLFTPSTLVIGGTFIIGLMITAFFVRQIVVFVSAPSLTITSPIEADQVLNPVSIAGVTSSQAVVTINNQPVIVNEDGIFNYSLNLSEGDHTIVVTTTSRSGKQRTLQRHITVVQ